MIYPYREYIDFCYSDFFVSIRLMSNFVRANICIDMHISTNNSKISGGFFLGHVAALITVAMWGYSFVSTKVLLENGMGPVQIYVCRFLLAYALVVLISHNRLWASNLREEGMFILCGICGGSIYFIAENFALRYTLTTNVSLLTSLSPLITVMLVGLVYKTEKLGKGTFIGSMIAIVGVGFVVFNSSTSVQVRPLGDFLSLAAACCWAVYSLILRQLNAHYDIWFISRKTFFYGCITAIPFLLVEHDSVNVLDIIWEPQIYGNLLFLGVGASTVGYVLWALVVKNLGAVKANNYMYFQPIMTLLVSSVVLGEHVSLAGYIGIFLILAGLWAGDNINKLQPHNQHTHSDNG